MIVSIPSSNLKMSTRDGASISLSPLCGAIVSRSITRSGVHVQSYTARRRRIRDEHTFIGGDNCFNKFLAWICFGQKVRA